MEHKIIVYKEIMSSYPLKETLFRPSEDYPEYLFKGDVSVDKNYAYEMVRICFWMYGMDKKNFGERSWNPLKTIISPNNNVVIKPNMVMDFNPSGDGTDCLYTHPSVVAAVVDYVIIALQGSGRIVIGDAPMQECNFDKLIEDAGYDKLVEYYQGKLMGTDITVELKDFRGYKSVVKNGVHHGSVNSNTDQGVLVDLEENSEFASYNETLLEKLRINSYNPKILQNHHNKDHHEYLLNTDILNADVVINMPKPKTHRKAGVTISLKNLVGINVRKEFLPHHCNGDSESGGDEYNHPNFLKKIKSRIQDIINIEANRKHYKTATLLVFLRKCITAGIRLSQDQSWDGSWYGNETISKTISDLNKILLYCDKKGKLHDLPQRKLFIVADMIIAGENEGPIEPTEKKIGLVAIGESPVCFDEVISTLMGMNVNKIPTIRQARVITNKHCIVGSTDTAKIISNEKRWNDRHIDEIDAQDTMHFIPPTGWIGHIEL